MSNYFYQRWSRGHKARGQGQGHKKISRPRTDPLEAQDKGRKRKCSQKKKDLQKFFSGDLKKKVLQKLFQAKKVFKNFFPAISTWGNQNKGLCRFSARFKAFSNKISAIKKWCCPRAEDRAIFEVLRLGGQDQGLQNVSSRTPPRVFTFWKWNIRICS